MHFCPHPNCWVINTGKPLDRQLCHKTLTYLPFKKENMAYWDRPLPQDYETQTGPTAPTVSYKKEKMKKVDRKAKKSIKRLVKKLKKSGFPLTKEQLHVVKQVCRKFISE